MSDKLIHEGVEFTEEERNIIAKTTQLGFTRTMTFLLTGIDIDAEEEPMKEDKSHG